MNEKEKAKTLKDSEVKLIAELMKNSRRSDRELARILGVSQPTVSRTIKKLEKERIIQEYTIIPNFNKLGYHVCALSFANFATPTDLLTMRKMIEEYGKRLSEIPQAVVIERGIGEEANGVVISFHESYSDYRKFIEWLNQFSSSSKYSLRHFIIDLDDKIHLRYLTFSTLAEHFLRKEEAKRHE
jgi:DNA-binding Lrp family transcriptional regulator